LHVILIYLKTLECLTANSRDVPEPFAAQSRRKSIPCYEVAEATFAAAMAATLGTAEVLSRSQPAASHERGIENSDQPQSVHTRISGGGFIGG
jgi:hypothetical protein